LPIPAEKQPLRPRVLLFWGAIFQYFDGSARKKIPKCSVLRRFFQMSVILHGLILQQNQVLEISFQRVHIAWSSAPPRLKSCTPRTPSLCASSTLSAIA